MNYLLEKELALFRFLNLKLANPFLDVLMRFFSSDEIWIYAILLFVYYGVKQESFKKTLFALLLLGLAIAITDLVCFAVIKPFFMRSRPCFGLTGVRLVVSACGNPYSFPSNHAANSACFAFFLWIFYKKLRALLFLFAFLVGFSRIYVGVHYPFDVGAGFIIGGLFGSLFAFLKRFAAINI